MWLQAQQAHQLAPYPDHELRQRLAAGQMPNRLPHRTGVRLPLGPKIIVNRS